MNSECDEDEIIEIVRSPIKQDPVGHGEDLGFYSKWNGKLLSDFQNVSKMLNSTDFKTTSLKSRIYFKINGIFQSLLSDGGYCHCLKDTLVSFIYIFILSMQKSDMYMYTQNNVYKIIKFKNSKKY